MKDSNTLHKSYRLIENELVGLAELQKNANLSFEDKLIRCIASYCAVRSKHREAFDRVFFDLVVKNDSPTVALYEERFRERVLGPWLLMIDQAMVRGEVRMMPSELLLNYLLTFLQGFISLSDDQKKEWLDQGELHTLILKGLKPVK
jgi:hypothetical protein